MRGSPSGVLGLAGRPSWGAHGLRQPRPGLPAPYLDSGLRLAGAGSASPAGGGASAGRAGPAPRPTRGLAGRHPRLGRAPPLLADSGEGPLAARGPCPALSGALLGEWAGISPMQGEGNPWARTPRKTEHGPGGRPPRDQPHLSGQGRQCLPNPRDSGSPGRVLGGEGPGSEDEGVSSHPLTGPP